MSMTHLTEEQENRLDFFFHDEDIQRRITFGFFLLDFCFSVFLAILFLLMDLPELGNILLFIVSYIVFANVVRTTIFFIMRRRNYKLFYGK